MLDCDIVVSESELQSRYYACFRTNTLGMGMNPFIPSYGLDSNISPFYKDGFFIKQLMKDDTLLKENKDFR